MKCPECGADLGKGSYVEVGRLAWICSKCNIKIYKEEYVKTKN